MSFAGSVFVRQGSESIIASHKLFDELIVSRKSKVYEILKWKKTKEIITVEATLTVIEERIGPCLKSII